MLKDIVIKGAREHNLKDIDVTIPRNKFVVVTGLSGSGKSTLAFDTIYAEGQRRYVESLSAYARQFLGLMSKPDVDSIDGLSPAISIEQKTTSKNPRSTVGTVTEIYDYLRLLFARIGRPHCPVCAKPISPQTADMIVNQVLATLKGRKVQVLAPIVRQKKGTYERLIQGFAKQGFVRVRVNKNFYNTDEKIPLDRYRKHDIEVVVDRIEVSARRRLQEAVESALKLSSGYVIILDERKEYLHSSHYACSDHPDVSFEELQPRMFSFNSPFGACAECHGLGIKQKVDPSLIFPDMSRSIADGAIACWRNHLDGWRNQQIAAVAKVHGFDMLTPIKDLKKSHMDAILFGSQLNVKFKYVSRDGQSGFSHTGSWEGVVPMLERLYQQTESEYRRTEIERFMRQVPCVTCQGRRLSAKTLAVTIHGKSIIDVTDMSVGQSMAFFGSLDLSQKEESIAAQVLKEIRSRLSFLDNVGVAYLTLSRAAGTLSGGEAQRIRLATQIGSNLMGVLYILDEPSIGLHQRDNAKLIDTLHRLRDIGNTLIVVEHDEDTIRKADYVIDLGPGAGLHGGKVIATGTPERIMANPKSLTGQYLIGKRSIPVPKSRRASKGSISIIGASQNNLKHIAVSIPIGVFTCVTGVSGSGKSSLINETLCKAMQKRLYGSNVVPGVHTEIRCDVEPDGIIVIDQSPIGRTPRSNPATYTKVFDEVRALFAATKEARERGYKTGRFSFNVKGGRCEVCSGDGLIKIEMNFLPDVYITCEDCKGSRYNQETLQVTFNGRTIAEVLDMEVEQALAFFKDVPSIERKLRTLADVGLTYIKLGQSSTTLSGGEAQRIKLTRELAKSPRGRSLYILDEPTTGLHFEDVRKLLDVLNRLTDKGHTIVVIEHNLDVIKCADHIIDMGPEGGDAGGRVIAQGTPEQVAAAKESSTGVFLKKALAKSAASATSAKSI
ncbi:MAG: excinuclease ABC subunit UvrA [Nanoarchaeota archaeon]